MPGTPKFSVIIATYNWSSALKLALESIRAQTLGDFEVHVVGDACSDDSEDAVRSFRDSRFIWCNLPENCGSQWGPNNHGLSLARGEYVAYLGHDDLWWPTHLEVAIETFVRTGADVVAAATLLYGPPESGIRAVSGFFPNDIYTKNHFFPPSSMLHRKELARRIGGWRPPERTTLPVDYDFLVRCHEAGARIVSTGEFTVFKFTAAWRRDSYRWRDPSQQREYLARMKRDGETFRRKELTDTLRAATEDRLRGVEPPASAHLHAAHFASIIHDFKGSRKIQRRPSGTWADGKLRFPPEDDYQGLEWHGLEQHPSVGPYRWSGPSRQSTIVLPAKIDRMLDVTLLLVGWITEEILHSAKLHVNGVEIETRLRPEEAGRIFWSGRIAPDRLPVSDREEIRLAITVLRTYRPIDLEISDSRRWLGLAVSWVELEKATDLGRPCCT